MKKLITQWISEFLDQVNTDDITIGWDAGHCYAGVTNSVTNDFDLVESDYTPEERDEFHSTVDEWLIENEPPLFCAPYLTPEISDGYVSCDCYGTQDVDYVLSFIDLVEKCSPENKDWYRLEEMKKWCVAQQISKVR